MAYTVDFKNVSTFGLESSPFAQSLAGLRANEARYFMNKFHKEFIVTPASESQEIVDYVSTILKKERDIVFAANPLETATLQVPDERWGDTKWVYVFYESGLAVNVLYPISNPKGRAVGFKLSEGMEIPQELEGKFKFANMRSTLAGVIRGSYFVIKGEY